MDKITYLDLIEISNLLDSNKVEFIKVSFPVEFVDEEIVFNDAYHLQQWMKENKDKIINAKKQEYLNYIVSKEYFDSRELQGKDIWLIETDKYVSLITNETKNAHKIDTGSYEKYKESLNKFIN